MEEAVKADGLFKAGGLLDIEITKITNFGAFAKLPSNKTGLIHISQITDGFVKDINNHLKVGDKRKARVLSVNENGRIELSLKEETTVTAPAQKRTQFKNLSLEDKLKIFLKQSQDRQVDIKHREETRFGKR